MDLSDLEKWTRSALEAEARKRGLREPEILPRGELIRQVMRRISLAPLQAGRKRLARGISTLSEVRPGLATAFGLFGDLLPRPLRPLAKRLSTSVAAPAAARPAAGVSAPVPAAAGRSEPRQPVGPMVASIPEPDDLEDSVEEVPEAAWHAGVGESRYQPEPLRAEPVTPMTGHTVRRSVLSDEPIRTLSMARLFAAQGDLPRALSIYEELIARNSEDETARREAARLRSGEDFSGIPIQARPPDLPEARTMGEDRIRWEAPDGEHVTLHYHVSERGIARARAQLGSEGELALRLVEVRPDPDQVVRSEVQDHGPLPSEGGYRLGPLHGAARYLVALGLREGSRFVSIVHGSPPLHQ